MRESGILLPVFSLPGEYGIGGFSKEAYDFVDWLVKCKQRYWQILPLCPTGFGASPYQSYSTFAGNIYYISLEELEKEGLLTNDELALQKMPENEEFIDYERLESSRRSILRTAFGRFKPDGDFEAFCYDNKEWLDDYARFMTLKEIFSDKPWTEWDREYKLRHKKAMARLDKEYEKEQLFYKFLEYKFAKQWSELKAYANEKGILIIGDIPIYVAMDSADTWSNPELFKFDKELKPTVVAGCPPDYFSPEGQLWGNPVYNWKKHEKTGYEWWIKRLEHCFKIYDMLRLDHFRGFASYYEIKSSEKTAMNGEWIKGPGMDFFNRIKEELGDVPVIAEDLGLLTPDVFELLDESGYPGMKVLCFAFDDTHDSLYLPHKYNKNCVVYTGTHDNDTLVGWLQKVGESERKFICDYVGMYNCSNEDLAFGIIRLAMGSVADLAVIPMQDYLGLDSNARINTPATIGCNWKWRMRPGSTSEYLVGKIGWVTELFGRAAKKDTPAEEKIN